MIEAFVIDEVTEELSASGKAVEKTLELMNEQQPVLLGYLFSETFEVFTEREREFILFLVCVIWKSVFRVYGPQQMIKETDISAAEDTNWGILQELKGRGFSERLDVFFEKYPEEEELLAFVEDAILDDDESPVTTEGREPIFVSLKSIVDCLLLPNLNSGVWENLDSSDPVNFPIHAYLAQPVAILRWLAEFSSRIGLLCLFVLFCG